MADPAYGLGHPGAGGQVTAYELDALGGRTLAPAEDADAGAGLLQPRDDQPAEVARAAGDEDGAHWFLLQVSVTSARFRGSIPMTPGSRGT